MASWSVSRIFRRVSVHDFRDAVVTLKKKLEKQSSADLFVEVGLYRKRRTELSSAGIDRDTGSSVTRLNPVEAFQFVADPKDITPEMWREADYIEAVLHPVGGGSITARIEAKGLNSRQITFSAGPDDPGEQARTDTLENYRFWRKGDGVDSNRMIYGI
jgi:hypothetical protein